MSTDVTIVVKARNEAQAALQAVKGDLQGLGRVASSMKDQLAQAGAAMRNVGLGLTATITAPVVALGATALSAASDFEQAMNVMSQVTGATRADMAQMQAMALQLGRDTSFSAGEAADAMLELGKAGLETTDIMAAVPGVLALAAAGGVGLADAANVTTAALNAFGLEASASTEIANMLAAAANASSADISDLAQGFQQAGFAFSASGQSALDLATSMAILTNVGLTGSDAGTALKNAMMQLISPTDKAAATMAQLGIDVFDAQGEMLDWPDVIQEFATATAGMTEEARNAALSTILMGDGFKAMKPLLDAGRAGFLEMQAAVNDQGAAAAVADARMKGLGGAMEYFKGTIESTLIEAVLPFMDGIGAAMRQAADFVAGFSRLAPEVRNVIVVVTAAAAAIGPLLIGLGMLTSAVSAALPVLGAIGGAIAALASPIGLVAAAVAGLGIAFATDFMGIRTAATQAFAPLVAGFQRVRQAFATGMVTVDGVLKGLGATLLGLGTDTATAEISLQELATIFTGSAEAGAQFQAALDGIGAVLRPMREAFTGVITAFQAFGASGTWSSLVATVTGSLRTIGTAIAGVFSGKMSLPDLAGKIGEQFSNIAQAVRDAVSGADFGDLRASLSGALGLENIDLGQLRDSLAAFVGNIAAEITAFDWGGALTTAGNWLGGLASWVVGQITAIDWGAALATATTWLSGLTTWVVDAITGIDWGLALTTAGEWLVGLTTWVVDAITGIDWGLALTTAGDWLVGFTTWVKDKITTIDWGAALGTAREWVDNLAKAVAQKIIDTNWITVMADASVALAGGIKTSVTDAIEGISWEGVDTSLFGGLKTAAADGIGDINWEDALATARGANNKFRDAVLKELATSINDANVTGLFTGLPDAVAAEVKTIKWFDVGKAVAAGLQGALSFETLKTNATIAFMALNPIVGGAIAGINWIVSSEQFSGLRAAISGAITGINWGDINTSIQALWSTARDATVEASKGFHAGIEDLKWPVIPEFKWSEFVDSIKWPVIPEFKWSEFVDSIKWPVIPFFKWSDFVDSIKWPVIPSINWSDFIPPFIWPWGGGAGDGSGSGSGGSGGSGGAGQLGKSYAPGGWTWVGEAGPELVHMPRGAEIVPNRQSMALATAASGPTVNVYGGLNVRSDMDVHAIAYQVADILMRG